MPPLRVAIIYDDSVRPDTTGFYCRRAMSCLARTTHVRPSEIDRIDIHQFDLFVNIDDGLRYRLPARLRPCAWWAIDTHLDFDWYLQKALDFDFVFTAQRDAVTRLADQLACEAHWLPLGCDPAFHRPHARPKKWNLAFIGNLFPGPRSELIELLQRQFRDVLVDRRYFDEMAQVYSEARIVFNRSIRNDINMRVFEATASGSLLLTNDLSDNGLDELFEYGKHLEVYGSPEELIDKVAFYLVQEHARERIARSGRSHVYRYHTYLRRMQTMIDLVAGGLEKTTVWIPGIDVSFRPNNSNDKLTSIVIPTFNQLELTRQCLDSLRANTDDPYELIVVDNGSTDGTVEYLEDCPDVILACNRENRGFPAATNQGMRLARGRHVVLLNNDTIVPPGWLGRLKMPLKDESIGLVGPCSNCVSGPQQIDATYTTLDELDEFAASLEAKNSEVVEDADRLVGFCLLVDRRVMQAIGLLDERFGLGCFEDDDYTLRARQAGFRTVIARGAFVHHFGSQTFLRSGIDFGSLMEQNRDRFQAKWARRTTDSVPAKADAFPRTIEKKRLSSQPKALLLAHFEFLRNRLDRSQFLRYLALEKAGVILFGPGVAGYRPGMSVEEVVAVACKGERPDWIIHGLDVRNSGVPLVGNLATCGIPSAYEFGDSWAFREEQARFINSQKFRLAFAFATCDIPFYRMACPATEIIFLPNAVDTSLFRDYGESKQLDVLVYGALNPEFYPCRARIARALKHQAKLRVHTIVHPDYYPRGGWDNEQVFAGEKLSRVINQSWIAIATGGVLGVLFMKYLEIASSGAVIAGDMPKDGLPFLADSYLDLSCCVDDNEIVDRLVNAIEDKMALREMALRGKRTVCEELSTERFAARLLEVLADWSASETLDVSDSAATVSTPLRASLPRELPPLQPLQRQNSAYDSRVSLCMIVRDNELTLDACLASIKPWVDEMIVVDTGSKDRTVEIAESHGARVFHFAWPDSFAVARNESLRHASGDWIFWMDSDDTISPENGQRLRDLLSAPPPEEVFGFVMQVHCPSDSLDGDDDATVVDHVKLFRNHEALRFEGRIHEQIMPAIRRGGGDVAWTDIFVVHSGADQTAEGRQRKQQRDLRLLRLEEQERPDNSFVLFNIGMTFADMDDHPSAVDALERSIQSADPTESHVRKAYALLIASLCQLGRFDHAEQVCRRGLELFTQDTELLFREGFIAQHLGQLERAAEGYRRALEPSDERHFSSLDRGLRGYKTRHNLALVYEDLRAHELAEEQWRMILAEEPAYRPGWHGLVGNLIAQGKLAEARNELAHISARGKNATEICMLQAQVAQASGDVREAQRLLEEGLSNNPGCGPMLEQLCKLLFEFSSPSETEVRLKELIGLAPTNPSAWHNLGSTYLRLNQVRAAEDAFRRAISLRFDSAASHLYLGFTRELLGDAEGAHAAWLEATRAEPQSPFAREAEERLATFDRQRSP